MPDTGGVKLGAPVSDSELWECSACGVRGLTTERNVWCTGTGGVRTPLMTLRVCSRCYHLHFNVCQSAVLYRLLYGKTMPQLLEWLAKSTEPQFDIKRHILRRRSLLPEQQQEVEPYVAKKIIVQIGA